jgi:hypothetical protein
VASPRHGDAPSVMGSGDGLTKVLLETQRMLEQKNQELLKVTMRFAETQKEMSMMHSRDKVCSSQR